jgi:transposase
MGAAEKEAPSGFTPPTMEHLMTQPNGLGRSLVPFVQDRMLVAVIELSLSSWLVAGVVPGVERQPLKKLEPDEAGLLRLLQRWLLQLVT